MYRNLAMIPLLTPCNFLSHKIALCSDAAQRQITLAFEIIILMIITITITVINEYITHIIILSSMFCLMQMFLTTHITRESPVKLQTTFQLRSAQKLSVNRLASKCTTGQVTCLRYILPTCIPLCCLVPGYLHQFSRCDHNTSFSSPFMYTNSSGVLSILCETDGFGLF